MCLQGVSVFVSESGSCMFVVVFLGLAVAAAGPGLGSLAEGPAVLNVSVCRLREGLASAYGPRHCQVSGQDSPLSCSLREGARASFGVW